MSESEDPNEMFRRLRADATDHRRELAAAEKTRSDLLDSLDERLTTCVSAIETLTSDSTTAHRSLRQLVESLTALLQSGELARLERFTSTFSRNASVLERASETLRKVPTEIRQILPEEVHRATRRARVGPILALVGVVFLFGSVAGWALRGATPAEPSQESLETYDAYVMGLYPRLNERRQAEIRQVRARVGLPPMPEP